MASGPIVSRLTLPRLAVDLRTLLADGDDVMAVRWVAQHVTDIRSLNGSAEVECALARPDGTGHSGWDALLAGVAEREARRAGVPAPPWCLDPRLVARPFLFLVPTPGLRAYALARTPPGAAHLRGLPRRRRSGERVIAGLGAEDVLALLGELATELEVRGVETELHLVGGAAMALAYDRRRLTATWTRCSSPRTPSTRQPAPWPPGTRTCRCIG